jgi:hypothetical protein
VSIVTDGEFAAARLAVFDHITDTLVDLIDPNPEEVEEVRDNMANAADLVIQGLGLEILEVDAAGLITATLDLGVE